MFGKVKRLKIYGYFFIISLLFSCQNSSKKPVENIVKINLGDEPHTLHPHMARDLRSLTLMRMFFEGLTRIGPGDQIELALAKSYSLSSDQKTYTFKLRSTKWSNGDSLTAHDFVYAWKKIVNPQSYYNYASQLYVIKNAQLIKSGQLPIDDLGIRAIDNYTFEICLEHPAPYFLELLASPIFFPVNPVMDQKNSNWAENVDLYVCNGPFLPKKWLHQELILAQKNPLYWDESTVKLDAIEMVLLNEDLELQLFEKKQLDWVGSPLSTLSLDALPSLKEQKLLHSRSVAGTSFIRINTALPPFDHPEIRKALALAIDREAIVTHVTGGGQIPATGLVPVHMKLKEEPYFVDGAKEEARTLFLQILEELGMSKDEFANWKLLYAQSQRAHVVAQAIQQQWNEVLGIKIGLEGIESKVYYDRISKQDFNLALGSWFADIYDPINFLEVFKYKAQSTNNTNWENVEYAELLDASYLQNNPKERKKILAASEQILIDEMPVIPIFHASMLYIQNEALKDVFLSSLGGLDFKWAYLENQNKGE